MLFVGISDRTVLGKKQTGNEGTVSVEDKAKAQWKFNQVQCSVAIDVHDNLNLQNQTLIPGDYLTWSDDFSEGNRTVKTESDCPDGYTLSVYTDNVKPNSVPVLDDFSFSVTKGSSQADPGSVDLFLSSWTSLTEGEMNSVDIGEVTESDLSGNLNNVNGTEWIVDYRYLMDADDEPNREYFVEMTYVVSSR
ncbi:MAG: hypothetical protein ACLFVS_05315 [Candidatus Acetothermia bacterium]